MQELIEGKSYPMYDYTVIGTTTTKAGKAVPNPRDIIPKGKRKRLGVAVKVQKAISFGIVENYEVNVWYAEGAEVDALNLKPDDRIQFYGKYEKTDGKKTGIVFHNFHVNYEGQIERFSARTATPEEI